ncbi:MAG: GlsB/YeaQ/YmgE family stress response membrane protein [Chloroflexi bacterium]|nr:GlsB/YeaQ/YmgE family stress response membrane protein [Chloroflexota bacterium]
MPAGLDPLGWIVIGFIAGAVAGWFVPDRERMGCLTTTLPPGPGNEPPPGLTLLSSAWENPARPAAFPRVPWWP